MQENLNGFILINKPKNITSYDCIRHIKKILRQKIKIGHTGTLDDFATGLLIICIGRKATKLSSTLLNSNKEYVVTAKLGELTDSLDLTGKIIEQDKQINISETNIKKAIKQLGSEYVQIPPIYSALKHKGKPLYKLARNEKLDSEELNKIIEQKSRNIRIFNIELLKFESPFFTIKTTVSKGCYIRSLANDIAKILNSYATTYELERTKIGKFDIQNSIDLNSIKTLENILKNIQDINQM